MGRGFDTVAYSFPVRAPDTRPGAMLTMRAEDWGGSSDVRSLRKLPTGGTLRSGVGGYAVVEISSKYSRPDAVEPMVWSDSVEAVRSAYGEAQDYVEATDGFDGGRFVRVDVVRDFDHGRGWPVVASALEPSVRFPRARSRLFRDRSRNNSLMLAIGNSGWRAAIYDKHAESYGRAPEGRLRYEYRQGRDWCRRLHVSLESPGESVERGRQLFHECRFSAKVGGMDSVLQEILESSELSTSVKLRLLGWVFAESRKVSLGMSPTTDRKYRRLAAGLGIVPTGLDDRAVVVSLNFDRGVMETEVAA